MKLAIVGSRSFNDYKLLVDYIVKEFNVDDIDTIVSGGASGADALGERFAREYDKQLIVFYPQWHKYGKLASSLRNADIIRECDECVCFWDGKSKGTKQDIHLCEIMGKPCKVCQFKQE